MGTIQKGDSTAELAEPVVKAAAQLWDYPDEENEDFRNLPTRVKDMVREKWVADQDLIARCLVVERNRKIRCVLSGVLLLLAFEFLGHGFNFPHLAVAALAGAVVGSAWLAWDTGQLRSPIVAMPIYFILQVFWWSLGDGNTLMMLMGPWPLGFVSSYMGAQRQEA